MTLLQELVKRKIIEKDKALSVEAEAKTLGRKVEEIILERRLVPEAFLFNLKSETLKIPLKKITPSEVPLEVLRIIPEESTKHYSMIPLGREGEQLHIGMVYPDDLQAQDALKFLARQGRFSYKVFLISLGDYKGILKRYRTLKGEVEGALQKMEAEVKSGGKGKEKASFYKPAEFERMAEEAPVTKVVSVILRHAVEGNASDIHIEPIRDKVRVRFRLMGLLHSSIFLPREIHAAIIARIKILSRLKIDETRVPQDGRFSTKVGDKMIDFRVSTFPTSLGEKVAIRILDPSMGLKGFKELGLTGENFQIVKKGIERPYGLIFSTGPTGCGKTTTLYAILRILNKESVNTITLEDPVEYFIEGVNQSQVRPEIGYTFAKGLRSVVRQDPDIIMVGEVRDPETAGLVIHAGLTGHIVLSTIHTNTAAGVIPRLIDLEVEPYLIPPALNMTIAQRLLRKLCPYCKEKVKAKKETRDIISKNIDNLPAGIKEKHQLPASLEVYKAVGCKKCSETGYSGRVGIFEVLMMTEQLSDIVLRNPSETEILKEAKRQGMITMEQDGILKVLEGVTTLEEVLRVSEES